MNVSVSRIQRAWSTSFIYSAGAHAKRQEWLIAASHSGQTLRIFVQGIDGVRCLKLNGFSRENLSHVKRIRPTKLARQAVTTCTQPELDLEHYFLTVLSNAIILGKTTPLSHEMVMEIMEIIGDYRESAHPEGLKSFLLNNDLQDLEDGAERFHPCKTELEFWTKHWTSIINRITEESKREVGK